MQHRYWHNILIVLTGTLVYYNTLYHGWCLDDDYILRQLPDPASGWRDIFSVFQQLYGHADYRPVVILSFALEQWIFGGLDVNIAHGVNVFLFLLIGIMSYRVISLLPVQNNRLIALAAVLFFLTHPVHSGVVSSLKNRDNLLSMLFGILSWYFAIRAVSGKNEPVNLALSAICMVVALFAKLDALSFLLIIPVSLYLFYPEHRKRTALVSGILLLALFTRALAVVYLPPAPNSVSFTENPVVENLTLFSRLAQSLQTLAHYIQFMIVPGGYWFYFGYDTLPVPGLFEIKTIFYLILHGAALFTLYHFRKSAPLINFGLMFFYLALLYCSNFLVPVAGILADRYAFIASLGFCIFIAAFLFHVASRIPASGPARTKMKTKLGTVQPDEPAIPRWLVFGIGIICLIQGIFTFQRNKAWKDMESLLSTDMPHLTRSFEANRIAASYYFKKALEGTTDADQRKKILGTGLQYALNAQSVYDQNLYISESIGQAYFNTGQTDAAIAQLRRTLRLSDTSRISMEVLGDIYYLRNQPDSALYYYQMSLTVFPRYEPVYFKYLRTLFKQQDPETAKKFVLTLLEKEPGWHLPYQCLSYYFLERKDSLEGLRWYKTSFDKGYRNPSDAASVRDKLLRYGDTLSAREMSKYIQP